MKQIEFKTEKATFLLVDLPTDDICGGQHLVDTYGSLHFNLKEITEEEASEIVGKSNTNNRFKDYTSDCEWHTNIYTLKTAIESLHSLIKSKGVHLYSNPYKTEFVCTRSNNLPNMECFEAEPKTFYNPVIFIKSK